MIYRSRAPLRVSFAGGGTDIPSYFLENNGGQVISTTIDKYIYTSASFNDTDDVVVYAYDLGKTGRFKVSNYEFNGEFDIIKAVLKYFNVMHGVELYIHSDMPAGSGMGTSSCLTVALIGLFSQYKKTSLSKYEIAELACNIERKQLKLEGGYQDQYASTFGGFNYIKFGKQMKVFPIQISQEILEELDYRFILCFTGKTHISAEMQKEMLSNYETIDFQEGMRLAKQYAEDIRDILILQDPKQLAYFGMKLNDAWEAKKRLSAKISNENIERLYLYSLKHGALGGKLLGAGGGGYLLLFTEPLMRKELMRELEAIGCEIIQFRFDNTGVMSWRVS